MLSLLDLGDRAVKVPALLVIWEEAAISLRKKECRR
jgi:hypothetical protein